MSNEISRDGAGPGRPVHIHGDPNSACDEGCMQEGIEDRAARGRAGAGTPLAERDWKAEAYGLIGALGHALLVMEEMKSFVTLVAERGIDRFGACVFCARHLGVKGHAEGCKLVAIQKRLETVEAPKAESSTPAERSEAAPSPTFPSQWWCMNCNGFRPAQYHHSDLICGCGHIIASVVFAPASPSPLVEAALPVPPQASTGPAHSPDCDSLDLNPEGITKPCNCKAGPAEEPHIPSGYMEETHCRSCGRPVEDPIHIAFAKRPAQPAPGAPVDDDPDELRGRIHTALRNYRCYHTVEQDNEDGMPLVDLLSPGETVAEGKEELEYLADYVAGEISDLVPAKPQGASTGRECPGIVTKDLAGWTCTYDRNGICLTCKQPRPAPMVGAAAPTQGPKEDC